MILNLHCSLVQLSLFQSAWKFDPDDAKSVHIWVCNNKDKVLKYQIQTESQARRFRIQNFARCDQKYTTGYLNAPTSSRRCSHSSSCSPRLG